VFFILYEAYHVLHILPVVHRVLRCSSAGSCTPFGTDVKSISRQKVT